VKIIGGGAEIKEGRGGRKLLRIKITAEVDGVGGVYAITFGRYGSKNEVAGYARAKADAPGDRMADAERLAAVVKALISRKPRMYCKKRRRSHSVRQEAPGGL